MCYFLFIIINNVFRDTALNLLYTAFNALMNVFLRDGGKVNTVVQ